MLTSNKLAQTCTNLHKLAQTRPDLQTSYMLFYTKLRHFGIPKSSRSACTEAPCYLWAIRGWLGECSKMVEEAATGHLLPRNPHRTTVLDLVALDRRVRPAPFSSYWIHQSHCAANIHKDQTWNNPRRERHVSLVLAFFHVL